MRKSRLSQYKQNKLSELFIAGITARTATELTGGHKNTAEYDFHRLRVLITEHVEQHAKLNRESEGAEQPAKSLFSGFYSGETGFTQTLLPATMCQM